MDPFVAVALLGICFSVYIITDVILSVRNTRKFNALEARVDDNENAIVEEFNLFEEHINDLSERINLLEEEGE